MVEIAHEMDLTDRELILYFLQYESEGENARNNKGKRSLSGLSE